MPDTGSVFPTAYQTSLSPPSIAGSIMCNASLPRPLYTFKAWCGVTWIDEFFIYQMLTIYFMENKNFVTDPKSSTLEASETGSRHSIQSSSKTEKPQNFIKIFPIRLYNMKLRKTSRAQRQKNYGICRPLNTSRWCELSINSLGPM
jgi:hypothetical protein